MSIKCFWTEPTKRRRQWLRRYVSGSGCPNMPGEYGYHNAEFRIEDGDEILDKEGYSIEGKCPSHDDPRWPKTCSCGYEFKDEDNWQLFYKTLYKDADGNEHDLHHPTVGMMWNAWWRKSLCAKTSDGIVLMVMTPGGEWCVDSRANNCTKPDDNEHFCWCRHGDPINGTVHVDKECSTCAAGAGSILCGNYHGFLHNGYLT